MSRTALPVFIAGLFLSFMASGAASACKRVEDAQQIAIAPAVLHDLAKVGISRGFIFDALKDVSATETSGCWAGATGNFDAQIVSVGVLQWNYGQGSLQPVMRRFRDKFPTSAGLSQELTRLMPNHGRLVFSAGCLAAIQTADCRDGLLAQQSGGHLSTSLKQEFDALFESDAMVQVQVDYYVRLLTSVKDDLLRLFKGATPTPRQIRWAIDTKVQQGGFPGNADIDRVRKRYGSLSAKEKVAAMLAITTWYDGLCHTIDQGGVQLDCDWNVEHWRKTIQAGAVPDEQFDLLHLTLLKSRTAVGMSGHWQALTFQRRATIVLGVGSVAGKRVGA